MPLIALLSEQLKRNTPAIPLLYLSAVGILAVAALLDLVADIPVRDLIADPTRLTGVPPWSGAISNIGILFWCAAMTLCFAAALVLRWHRVRADLAGLLIASGWLTAFLLLDDFFVLHESFRDYLGVPEQAFFGLYALWFCTVLVRHRDAIRQTDYLLLVLAVAFLGLSMVTDLFQAAVMTGLPASLYFLIEEGLKLMGIVGWFGYFTSVFRLAVLSSS